MQGPPRFQMMPGYGGVTMVSVPFVQTPTYFMPNNLLAGGQRLISQAPVRRPTPTEKPPQTTAFVGNIHDRCSNDLIRAMLQECGNVVSWKRIQGSSGKFQAFGFCEFDHPESTLRALRLLHDMRLGDKKLVVKVDEKTGELLRSFVAKQRQQQGKPALQLAAGEMPMDEEMTKNDEHYRRAINLLVEHEAPDLLSTEDGEITARSPTLQGKGGNLDVATLDRDKKEYIRDEIERFRQTHKEDEQTQKAAAAAGKTRGQGGRSPNGHQHSRSNHARPHDRDSRKRSRTRSPTHDSSGRRSKRARSPTASSSDDDKEDEKRSSSSSPDSASSRDSSVNRHRRSAFKSRSPSRSPHPLHKQITGIGGMDAKQRDHESEDSDDARERRMIQKQMREKEAAYQARLKSWESRERRIAKEREKNEQREKMRKRDEQKEAKKLKEFLEDYDDDRDDPKYYKSSSLFQRRREYEREREMDAKDRHREQEEIEELKRQVLAEGKVENADEEALKRHREQEEALLRKMRADSGSPSPHCPLGQKPVVDGKVEDDDDDEDSEDSSSDSASDSDRETEKDKKPKKEKEKEKEHTQPLRKMKPVGWVAVDGDAGALPLSERTPMTPNSTASPSTSALGLGGSGGGQTTKPADARLNGVFGDDVDDLDEFAYMKNARKKLKPFEITNEDRMQAMTPEERKKTIKDLIEKIPTTKDELFDFAINWDYVDEILVERRVKPWVTKKIVEYIGEEEPTLVDFICQKVNSRTPPKSILEDISMVLDDEAEVFVVKMWRLLIYESEAKKLGLVKVT